MGYVGYRPAGFVFPLGVRGFCLIIYRQRFTGYNIVIYVLHTAGPLLLIHILFDPQYFEHFFGSHWLAVDGVTDIILRKSKTHSTKYFPYS
jgi:hypothetical protein